MFWSLSKLYGAYLGLCNSAIYIVSTKGVKANNNNNNDNSHCFLFTTFQDFSQIIYIIYDLPKSAW